MAPLDSALPSPATPAPISPAAPLAPPQTASAAPHAPSSSPGFSSETSSPSTTATLSPGTASTAATSTFTNSSSPLGAVLKEGQRTPSGFEFLDWGDGVQGQKGGRSFDWEIYGADSPASLDLTQASHQTFKRRLGPTEVSYYLGSRGEGDESGANDMYLHIGFKALPSLVRPARLLDVWTEIISRHALLASTVEYGGVNEIRFCYDPPKSSAAARAKAESLMELRSAQDPKELLATYLNGPRTLSDDRLAYLLISLPEPHFTPESTPEQEQEYDFCLFSTHFLGDGMALHSTANEFFGLLAGEGEGVRNIESVLREKGGKGGPSTWEEREEVIDVGSLAQALESKLLTPAGWGRMAWAAARVEYDRTQAKLIGGQAFPRAQLGERKTVVPTISYDLGTTKRILATCKAHGTTIANAVFALSNLAYIRSVDAGSSKGQRDERLPCMLYSALNVRPFLVGEGDWYHIAIGYYNIILPSFLPRSLSPTQTFWHRAASTRAQTSAIVKSRWLPARAKLMALERERRSIGFEKEDERRKLEKLGVIEKLEGLGLGDVGMEEDPVAKVEVEKKVGTPSVALMGVSMLGNLDAMYKHTTFNGIKLHTLTTGSRQRPRALLLFAYTFADKLWFSLGYDVNGFEERAIEKWWSELQSGVEEFLLS